MTDLWIPSPLPATAFNPQSTEDALQLDAFGLIA